MSIVGSILKRILSSEGESEPPPSRLRTRSPSVSGEVSRLREAVVMTTEVNNALSGEEKMDQDASQFSFEDFKLKIAADLNEIKTEVTCRRGGLEVVLQLCKKEQKTAFAVNIAEVIEKMMRQLAETEKMIVAKVKQCHEAYEEDFEPSESARHPTAAEIAQQVALIYPNRGKSGASDKRDVANAAKKNIRMLRVVPPTNTSFDTIRSVLGDTLKGDVAAGLAQAGLRRWDKESAVLFASNETNAAQCKQQLAVLESKGWRVEDEVGRNPLVIVFGVRFNGDKENDGDRNEVKTRVVAAIRQQAESSGLASREIEARRLPGIAHGKANVVIQVSPQIKAMLMEKGLRCGAFDTLRVREFYSGLQCYGCYAHGHKRFPDCKKIVCPHCAGAHKIADCVDKKDASKARCVNCMEFNKSSSRMRDDKHAANSSKCPMIKQQEAAAAAKERRR
jgi:hypothetical protein